MDIPELPDCDTPAAVLAFAQAQRAAAQRAEARLLEAALVWADLHPEESLTTPVGGGDPGPALFAEVAVPLAGEGTPLVAEFAPMELGAALGMSTDSARALVGDALELAHRLPRTWKLVRDWCSGDAQVVIRPVIDLEAHHHTDAYAVPDRPADQTRLTQPVCAFPWCERPARRCDTDHVVAHGTKLARPAAATSPHSAGDITGQRPTRRGPTTRPTPRPTSGGHPTGCTW